MKIWLKYYLLTVLVFAIIDFTTTFFPDFATWSGFMPEVFLFYFGLPVIWTLAVYGIGLDGLRLVVFNIILGVVFELFMFNNPYLLSFPLILIAMPIMISTYNLIPFLPKWILEKKVVKNRKWLIVMLVIWLVTMILTAVNHI